MNLIPVTTLDTPELSLYREMRDNAADREGSFIADSPKVVNMLLQSDLEVRSLLATQRYYDEHADLIAQKEIPALYVADKKMMESIVGHTLHHNVMMHGIRPAETPLRALGSRVIMLDTITSTENIGAIARSAAALGVGSYLLPRQGPHPYGRRALRVSMGYMSRLDYHTYDDIFVTLSHLKSMGYRIFAAEVTSDALPLSEVKVPEKWVLLMGHEGKGISPEVLAACDETVMIEMEEDVKSFNVGIAASIMMYRFRH